MQCGYNYNDIYLLFEKYSSEIKYINYKKILKLIYGIIIKRKIIINGLNDGEIIEKLINGVALKKQLKKMSDIKIPLVIPSVDINSGEIYYFISENKRKQFSDKIVYDSKINIGKAVRASCSYPLVFSPCNYNQIQLVDGGIRENVPWKILKQMGADKVISVIFEEKNDGKCCKNIIEIVNNSLDLLCHELSNYELIGADYLLKIKTKNISLLDAKKIKELYEIGYKTAKENIIKMKNNI